MEDKYD